MSEAKEKILQLLPAEGWEAMFEDEDNVAVVCFALVESTDEEGAVSSAVRPMASIGDAIVHNRNHSQHLKDVSIETIH